MGKSKPPEPRPAAAPFNNPFGGLAGKLGITPAAPETAGPAGGERTAEAPARRPGPARAVIRLERKGRGGKEATIVEKLELAPRELETWLGDLKRALGCGGQLESGALVLHGDLRPRVKSWLEARGVRKVTVG